MASFGSPAGSALNQARPYADPRATVAAAAAQTNSRMHFAHMNPATGQYAYAPLPPNAMPPPMQEAAVLPALTMALGKMHETTADRFERVDASLHAISGAVSGVHEQTRLARTDTDKLAQWIERSHALQIQALRFIVGRVDKLEGTVGANAQAEKDVATNARLERIECTLQELFETVNDPEAASAASPPVSKEDKEIATSPRLCARDMVDQGVDALHHVLVNVGIDAYRPGMVHTGTDAHAPGMLDASFDACTHVVDVGINTRPDLVDASVDAFPPTEVDADRSDMVQQTEDDLPGSPSFNRLSSWGSNFNFDFQSRFPSSPFTSERLMPAEWYTPADSQDSSIVDSFGVGSPISRSPQLLQVENRPTTPSIVPQEGRSPSASREASIPASSEPDAEALGLYGVSFRGGSGFETPALASPVSAKVTVMENDSPDKAPAPQASEFGSSQSPTIQRASAGPSTHTAPSSTVAPSPRAPSPAGSELSYISVSKFKPAPIPRNLSVQRSPALSSLSSLSSTSSSSSAPVSPELGGVKPIIRAPPPIPRIHPRVPLSLSPEVQIIQNPAAAAKGKDRSGNGGSLSAGGSARSAPIRKKGGTEDDERPRKRRKTEPGSNVIVVSKVGQTLPKRRGRPPKQVKTNAGPSSSSNPNGKARAGPPSTVCQWPPVIDKGDGWRDFVQCDDCDGSYHIGCAGMYSNDPRLKPGVRYICPACGASSIPCGRHGDIDLRNPKCLRPGCTVADADEWFVERFVGRSCDKLSGSKFSYLVKWAGFSILEASWTPEKDISNCKQFVAEFEKAARREGLNLNASDVVYLREAVVAGW